MKKGEFMKREKLQEKFIVRRRSYIKKGEGKGEGTIARSIERKREKSEDNSKGVVVLLIKMKLIEGEYKFPFWHCLTILT